MAVNRRSLRLSCAGSLAVPWVTLLAHGADSALLLMRDVAQFTQFTQTAAVHSDSIRSSAHCRQPVLSFYLNQETCRACE